MKRFPSTGDRVRAVATSPAADRGRGGRAARHRHAGRPILAADDFYTDRPDLYDTPRLRVWPWSGVAAIYTIARGTAQGADQPDCQRPIKRGEDDGVRRREQGFGNMVQIGWTPRRLRPAVELGQRK